MAKVTGVGGIFFKARDPEAQAAWYMKHLGVPFDVQMGCAIFRWNQDPEAESGATVWCMGKDDSDLFSHSSSSFVINYRVDDVATLVAQLKSAGITILKEPETYDHGTFASILDPEGNKIELWQPVQA